MKPSNKVGHEIGLVVIGIPNTDMICLADHSQELRTMQVDIGVLLNESTLHFMQNFPAATQPRCVVSLQSKCLFLYFKVGIRGSGPARADLIQHDYRLKITFLQLSEVFKTFDDATQQTSLLIVLDDSVICHRKVKNPHITFNEARTWRDEDSWYRQTTVTHSPSSQKMLPPT